MVPLRRLVALVCLICLGLGVALAGTVRPARADGTDGKVAGMVVSTLGQTESAATAMSALAADGVNTVSLFVWWWASQPSSNSIGPYDGTQSDASLSADISAAHASGLKVVLSPIFYCGGCQGGWRGVMQPSNLPAFFASYRAFIDHYAQLAQADNVWLLFVGSEMTSLEGQTAQWQSVISSARQYYSGQIGYEQNWDVVGQPEFLSDVDVVGVSAYYPLDDSADPSESQLLSDWTDSQNATYKGHNWLGGLIHLAATTGKPILFGEVGYMASDYAASQPFDNNYVNVNQTLQSNLYQALLTTFSGYSWWMGVAWWEWSDASGDAPRTPKGKSAETLLRNWYVNGWRPGSASAPVTTVPSGTSPTLPGSATGAAGTIKPVTGSAPAGSAGAGTASNAAVPRTGTTGTGGASPSGTTARGAGASAAASSGSGSTTGPSSASTLAGGASDPAGTSSGAPEAAGHSPVVISESGGERGAVQVLGAVALVALAATATAVPVLGLLPVGERRRRRAIYADFD